MITMCAVDQYLLINHASVDFVVVDVVVCCSNQESKMFAIMDDIVSHRYEWSS